MPKQLSTNVAFLHKASYKVINLVNAGEFDALLSQALSDMKSKFPEKEDTPKQEEPEGQSDKTEAPNNVTHMAKAS